MAIKDYDFSKFKEFNVEERDFQYKAQRAGGIGNLEKDEFYIGKVEVILDKYNLSVSCFKTKSQLKNKNLALDMMYLLLSGLIKN